MRPLDQLLVELVGDLVVAVGGADDGVAVRVTEIELSLPIEHRLARHGLSASTPRGRLATGFDRRAGRLRARLVGVGP